MNFLPRLYPILLECLLPLHPLHSLGGWLLWNYLQLGWFSIHSWRIRCAGRVGSFSVSGFDEIVDIEGGSVFGIKQPVHFLIFFLLRIVHEVTMVSRCFAEPLAEIMDISIDYDSDIPIEGIKISGALCVEGLRLQIFIPEISEVVPRIFNFSCNQLGSAHDVVADNLFGFLFLFEIFIKHFFDVKGRFLNTLQKLFLLPHFVHPHFFQRKHPLLLFFDILMQLSAFIFLM